VGCHARRLGFRLQLLVHRMPSQSVMAFRSLPDLKLKEEAIHTPLPLGPPDLLHGELSNGLK
jgi:hypothetical protein